MQGPAVILLVGILLVLAEIISSQVLLSQLGNLLIWSGSVAFAWLLVRGEAGASPSPGSWFAVKRARRLGQSQPGAPCWLGARAQRARSSVAPHLRHSR